MMDVHLPDERPITRTRRAATVRELRRLSRRRRSRYGTTLALAGALVVLSAVAAVGYGLIAPQERFESLGCYDRPSLDADVAVVGTSDRDPIDVCADLWNAGAVGATDAQVPDQLTACVLDGDDAIGVFPGARNVCETLGLQPLDDVDITAEDVSVVVLRDRLAERLPSFDVDGECIGTAAAVRRAEQTLDELRARDWTVTWQGADADGEMTCAVQQTLDVAARTVVLGGVPGPQSPEARVADRLATAGACVNDRDVARAHAEEVLRDLDLSEWSVRVEDDVWDANAEAPGLDGHERCASYQIAGSTVSVNSVIRDSEPFWRRLIPWL